MTARLALSIGCPSGIGPEVSVAAAADAKSDARILLVGADDVIRRAAKVAGVDVERLVRVDEPAEAWRLPAGAIGTWSPGGDASRAAPGKPRPADGAAQLAWIDAACDLASRGVATAMVTGPVSKDVIASSGAPRSKQFLGHTEHLQRRLHADEVVMAFWNERFTTALVTTHLPLARVARAITTASVARATFWLAKLLVQLGSGSEARPRIAVCGLNPHAGEAGRLGREEITAVAPGIDAARARLGSARRRVILEGPVPAETAFRKAARVDGAYEGVVAMYHDQATIPMKLVGFGESVNVSLGLPIVRTSVDHGTGYDIAGKGIADPRGMREAIALAVRLSASPGRTRSSRR